MMDKNIFSGAWEETKGKMKQMWAKLTDDDLKEVEGNQQKIYGKLQKHYGYTKDEAKKAVDDFNKS
tara:strand:- start:46 stop:243 length:198 start_codon:yes stop_codon:yes gene_type:complete